MPAPLALTALSQRAHQTRGLRTWNFLTPVRRESSRNSSWMLVTSATVLSDVHQGGWATPVPMLTSEYGILEGVWNAGISRFPKSSWCTHSEGSLLLAVPERLCLPRRTQTPHPLLSNYVRGPSPSQQRSELDS